MTKVARMITARYLDPTSRSFEQTIVGWLMRELPTANRFLMASGYLDTTVLDWLEEPISSLRGRGGTTSAIIGSNGGQTSTEDVERMLALFEDGLFLDYAEGGIFHPKVYVLEHPTRAQAAVASANFTTRGAIANVEAGLIVETDVVGPQVKEPIAGIVESLNPDRYPHAVQIHSPDDIKRLKSLGVLGRMVRQEPVTVTDDTVAGRQRRARHSAGFGRREVVADIPKRRPVPVPPPPVPREPDMAEGTPLYCGFVFAGNDLKNTGTRELSVSSDVRRWAADVLGREIEVGEGTLLEFDIEARLAASPGNIHVTSAPVRLWSAGASGGTHQDVRLVLGSRLKGSLDDESVQITGRPVAPGSIGVFELPAGPADEPVRLTVVLRDDREFPALEARLGKTGREQKLHFGTDRPPDLPDWP